MGLGLISTSEKSLEEKLRFEYLINVPRNRNLAESGRIIGMEGYSLMNERVTPLINGSYDISIVLDRELSNEIVEELKKIGYKIYKLL